MNEKETLIQLLDAMKILNDNFKNDGTALTDINTFGYIDEILIESFRLIAKILTKNNTDPQGDYLYFLISSCVLGHLKEQEIIDLYLGNRSIGSMVH